jgi:hypothetical protein
MRANPMPLFVIGPVEAPGILAYRTADEMIRKVGIPGQGQPVSYDNADAVDALLTNWHDKLIELAADVAWHAGVTR